MHAVALPVLRVIKRPALLSGHAQGERRQDGHNFWASLTPCAIPNSGVIHKFLGAQRR